MASLLDSALFVCAVFFLLAGCSYCDQRLMSRLEVGSWIHRKALEQGSGHSLMCAWSSIFAATSEESAHDEVYNLFGLRSLAQICLTAVAVALARAHSSNQPQEEKMLAINLTGLGANLIIGWGAWTVVRHRTFRTCAPCRNVMRSQCCTCIQFRSCLGSGAASSAGSTTGRATQELRIGTGWQPFVVQCLRKVWCLITLRLVRRRLYPIVDVLMPISFLQPILTFALVWSNGWEKWNAAYWCAAHNPPAVSWGFSRNCQTQLGLLCCVPHPSLHRIARRLCLPPTEMF